MRKPASSSSRWWAGWRPEEPAWRNRWHCGNVARPWLHGARNGWKAPGSGWPLPATSRCQASGTEDQLPLGGDVKLGLGPLKVQSGQSSQQQLLHGDPGVPLLVGRNHVPGRVRGARYIDGRLVRIHIVLPERPLIEVAPTV